MGIFRKSYCHCGSGKESGFCYPHKGADTAGVVRNGKPVQGKARIVRPKPKGK